MQEKLRIEYMLMKYNEELDKLPKGTISEKVVNGNIYYYLKYREGKKVVSQYIPKNEIDNVSKSLEKRKHIEVMVKSLNKEYLLARKVLEGNV